MTTLHVVSHTHWDREWYRTFQQFRFRLVGLIDRLLDLLEDDPHYRFFTLDGQTIVADDYLAIRPEQEARVRRLVQDGRLLVGPWYILPDEFLQGPEAMVRNLLSGRQGCRCLTGEPQPMERIGYIPDPFGHISQLPQIAAGFGMEALCFWRGVGPAPTEFRWAAPDGSELLVLHLRESYSNGAWLAADEAGFVRDLAAARDALAPHATTSHLLVMNGTDHMEPRADLPARLRAAEAALGQPVIHSTLPGYLAAVRAELGGEGLAGLPLLRGELRSPHRAHLLPAVLSARMWIKQWNARCETLLTRWAEPFGALAEQIGGGAGQRGFLREAWSWLLQNHPHDSICGCSVDQVHREMRTRFSWSEQIAEEVTRASLEAIARQIRTQNQGYDEPEASPSTAQTPPIVVFNPTPFSRTDRVRVRLDPAPHGAWHLADADGKVVRHRVLGRSVREYYDASMDREALHAWMTQAASSGGHLDGDVFFQGLDTRVEGKIAHLQITVGSSPVEASPEDMARLLDLLADDQIERFRVRAVEEQGLDVEFLGRDIPGLGYSQFLVTHDAQPATHGQPPTPSLPSPTSIENEFFHVEADPSDGTLTVTDKATGLVLAGVNRFVDGGDRGDEYTFCPPEQDTVVDTPVAPPTIRRVDDGLGSSLEISAVYRLPRSLADEDRSARSPVQVDLPITSRASLTPGVRRVEFATWVDNRAEDHRLRVHFPTPIVTDRSWAEGHFDVLERPVALPSGTEDWMEQPIGTHPQLTFVDVSDGQRGVMLLNRGLPEYEVLPGAAEQGGVTLALTLLRCVGWLSRGDMRNRPRHAGPAEATPEAQCPGEHTFHYALLPHDGNYLGAYQEAHAFNAPLRAVCTNVHDGPLPPSASFVEVSPAAVVLSAVKPPEEGEGLIVRVYNAAQVPVEARLKLWHPFRHCALVPLSEGETICSLAEDSETVSLPLRAKEIATLRFTFDAGPGQA
jgi:hypothetical protein